MGYSGTIFCELLLSYRSPQFSVDPRDFPFPKPMLCPQLPGTCSRDHNSIDSNLTSGTVNGGRSEVYINDCEAVPDAKEGINRYMNFYNQERSHQSLDYKTPAEVYFGINKQNRETSRYLKEANFVS